MMIDRERVLQLIAENKSGTVSLNTIVRHFKPSKVEILRLKSLLAKLVDKKLLTLSSEGRYSLCKGNTLVTGKLSTHRDGYGFVSLADGKGDVFVPARFLRENLHGDIVEVRVLSCGHNGKREGRIVRTITRGQWKLVGKYEEGRGGARVIPDDVRIAQGIVVNGKRSLNARNGQMVTVEITSYPTSLHPPEGRVIEVLGWPDDPEVESMTIIRKHGLSEIFPEEVLAAAVAVPLALSHNDLKGRTDLRDMLTVTIDGETARDFDDAVSIRQERGGNLRLWVSIADVSHYVVDGSPLDREAFKRGTSVYFPERCIPMLPEELSNGICSLNPDMDRITVTVEMLFSRSGTLMEATFYPSVIRSSARMTYTSVKKILLDNDSKMIEQYDSLVPSFRLMEKLASSLRSKRKKRGSIDFDLPEPEIVMGLKGETLDVVRAERNIAHRIIEEFMLAANEAVANYLHNLDVPTLYRIHEPPDSIKINDFREFIHNFGYELPMTGENFSSGNFQRLLEDAEGKPEERMINEVLLRCMKQARYSSINLGHYGLAAPFYTHFTSPIRRYPDLVVHRILKKVISGRIDRRERESLETTLPDIAAQSSRMERIAMDAEREIVDLKKIQFMGDKVGEDFDCFITGIMNYGFFVELSEFFVEGLVHISELPRDYYRYLEKQHALVGEKSKAVFRIGDMLRVRLVNVSLERKQLDFAPVEGEIKKKRVKEYINCDDDGIKLKKKKRRIGVDNVAHKNRNRK
jgi:ribonuclease R